MFTCYRTHCWGLPLLQHHTREKIHFVSCNIHSQFTHSEHRIAENFRRRKLSWIAKFGIVASFCMAKASNPQRFSQWNQIFLWICESFLLRKYGIQWSFTVQCWHRKGKFSPSKVRYSVIIYSTVLTQEGKVCEIWSPAMTLCQVMSGRQTRGWWRFTIFLFCFVSRSQCVEQHVVFFSL